MAELDLPNNSFVPDNLIRYVDVDVKVQTIDKEEIVTIIHVDSGRLYISTVLKMPDGERDYVTPDEIIDADFEGDGHLFGFDDDMQMGEIEYDNPEDYEV